jgi:hypothetical protein
MMHVDLNQYLSAKLQKEFGRSIINVDTLIAHIAADRERPIEAVAWEMPTGYFGARVATPCCDYIIYERNTPPIHQDHIKCHELAHILARHRTGVIDLDAPIGQILLSVVVNHYRGDSKNELYSQAASEMTLDQAILEILLHNQSTLDPESEQSAIDVLQQVISGVLLRSQSGADSPEELEAEAIAEAIQNSLIRSAGLAALTRSQVTTPGWNVFAEGLGLDLKQYLFSVECNCQKARKKHPSDSRQVARRILH